MLHENLLFYLLSSSTPVLYYLDSFIEIEGRVVSVVGGKNTGLGGVFCCEGNKYTLC